MKKFRAKILVSAFVLTFLASLEVLAQNSAQTPHIDVAQTLNIKISGGATFVFQGTSKDNVGKPNDGSNTIVYVGDLKLEKTLENNGIVVVCFKGGKGDGLSKTVQTYANVSAVSDPTFIGELETLKVTDLYYKQSCFNDKLTISFGKLNFTSYFTGNRY